MHLYAFDMPINENDHLAAALSELRESRGWSQEELGRAIGISQGHASKILRKIKPLSNRLKARASTLLASTTSAPQGPPALEEDVVAALRTSGPFRALVAAALEMHKKA